MKFKKIISELVAPPEPLYKTYQKIEKFGQKRSQDIKQNTYVGELKAQLMVDYQKNGYDSFRIEGKITKSSIDELNEGWKISSIGSISKFVGDLVSKIRKLGFIFNGSEKQKAISQMEDILINKKGVIGKRDISLQYPGSDIGKGRWDLVVYLTAKNKNMAMSFSVSPDNTEEIEKTEMDIRTNRLFGFKNK